MREEKAARARLEAAVLRVATILATSLPYLATKADVAGLRSDVDAKLAGIEVKLADKPGKAYMWGIMAALLTAYACGLAALAVLK